MEPWCEKLYTQLAKRFGCKCDDENSNQILSKETDDKKLISDISNTLKATNMVENESDKLLPYLGFEPKIFSENEVSLVQGLLFQYFVYPFPLPPGFVKKLGILESTAATEYQLYKFDYFVTSFQSCFLLFTLLFQTISKSC